MLRRMQRAGMVRREHTTGAMQVKTRWHAVGRSLIGVVALGMVVAGCSASEGATGNDTGSSAPKRGGELVMAVNVEGQTMDPAWCSTYAFDRCAPVFGTLLRYDTKAQEFVPGMAESFDSPDGKTWTLKLREGVKFTDGTDFDAEAVAFNWDRIKDPATLSPAAQTAAPLSWKVVDPTTLEVTLEQSNFQLPWALTQFLGMVGSPTAITNLGKDFGNSPIGAGPFVLKKWVRNSQAEFTPNPDYWEAGVPYVDSFVLKVIGQDDQRLNALRTGAINIDWSLMAKDAKAIESQGFAVYGIPLVGGTGLNFNHEDPDLKDPQLRLALLKAVDSEQITKAVYPSDEPVDAFLFPDSPYRDDSLGIFPAKDLAGAQKLFDDYLAKTGKNDLTLSFSTFSGLPALEQVAQLLQSQLQQIKGLTFNIDAMDYVTLQGNLHAGKFQLGMAGSLSQQMDALYAAFHTDGSLNFTHYSNSKVDAALETSRASNDSATIAAAYKVVNGEISKDGPVRNWRYQTGFIFAPTYVKDVMIVGTNSGAGVHLERAWIDK